jgi:hypothetical protein
MWIDISEEQLAEFRARKWQLAPDSRGRFYLISPDGASKFRAVDVPSRDGLHLYIVRALSSARFKIGISKKPPQRLIELQVGSSLKLAFITVLPIVSSAVERRAHGLLKEWRAHGEWFDLGSLAGSFVAHTQRCRSCEALLAYLGKVAEKNAMGTGGKKLFPTEVAVGNSVGTEAV